MDTGIAPTGFVTSLPDVVAIAQEILQRVADGRIKTPRSMAPYQRHEIASAWHYARAMMATGDAGTARRAAGAVARNALRGLTTGALVAREAVSLRRRLRPFAGARSTLVWFDSPEIWWPRRETGRGQ